MASSWALAARLAVVPLQASAPRPGQAVMWLMGNKIWSEPPACPLPSEGGPCSGFQGRLSQHSIAQGPECAWAWPAGSDTNEMTKSAGSRLARRYSRCC